MYENLNLSENYQETRMLRQSCEKYAEEQITKLQLKLLFSISCEAPSISIDLKRQ
jgi:hypothetical protein